jgi:hypothetical protein
LNLATTVGDFAAFDVRQKSFMLFVMLGVMVTVAFAIGQLTGLLSSADERCGEMLRRAGASEVVIADRRIANGMLTHLGDCPVLA